MQTTAIANKTDSTAIIIIWFPQLLSSFDSPSLPIKLIMKCDWILENGLKYHIWPIALSWPS